MPASLDDHLVLHMVQNEQDAAKFVALNEAVTGEGPVCERLLHQRPETHWSDFCVVEDTQTGQVVSTTCLLPWRCQLDGVDLRVAMLEMVVTDPAYRQRGLVRAQVLHFQQEVAARGFDFSIIQGIPYYYRQFGYGYALDHTRCDRLPLGDLPAREGEDAFRLRDAAAADLPALAELYDECMRPNHFSVLRTPDDWRYLLDYCVYPIRVLESAVDGHIAGYVRTRVREGQVVRLEESAITTREAGLALLSWLASQHPGGLDIVGPAAHPLVRLARECGSQALPCYQWLLRLHDPAAFLNKIKPVLEKRLAQSELNGLNASLTLNFYRQALRLQFAAGRLEQVRPAGFIDSSMGASGGDLCIPPDAFLRLAFGYRGLDKLADAWPDTEVREETRAIWNVLFPRFDAWVLMPY